MSAYSILVELIFPSPGRSLTSVLTNSSKDSWLKLPWESLWRSAAPLQTSTTATGERSPPPPPPPPPPVSPFPSPRSEFYNPSLQARVREEYLMERSHLRNTGIKTSRIHHGRFIKRSPSDGPALDPEGNYRSVSSLLSPHQITEIQSNISDPANLNAGTRPMETRTHPGLPLFSSRSCRQNVIMSLFALFV